jgi:hypothetical protein
MNGKFHPRTEVGPTLGWLDLPEIRETLRAPRLTWRTRVLWFAIGMLVALILRGA